MANPADPGWALSADGCQSLVGAVDITDTLSAFQCELDADHDGPHTVTLTWFDPAPEPDCTTCSDTGQVLGEPCPQACSRALALQGSTAPNGDENPAAATTAGAARPYGRWGDDE